MSSYFVTSVTGHQGGAVAHQLLSRGHSVQAIVRNIDSEASRALINRGATLYQGSYYDSALLSTAVKGVVGVFLNPHIDPDDPNGQSGWARTVLGAAADTGTVKHVVASSAFQTGRLEEFRERDENFPLRSYYETKAAVEQVVKEMAESGTGYTWTILRPAWLMFNYLAPDSSIHYPELYTSARELAVVYKPGVKMPHFDEQDLGKFAVAAFQEPSRFAGETIELGCENLTIDEAAGELSKAAGVEIYVRRREDEEKEKMASVVATQGFHELANWTDISIPEGSLSKWGFTLTTFSAYLKRNNDKLKMAFATTDTS